MGFCMDRYEFPNRAGQAPVGKVVHKEAVEACEKVGKRLCSALEWEKACKGPSNQIYSYGDTRLGQGRENAKIFLGENPAIAAEIDGRIRQTGGLPVNLSRRNSAAMDDEGGAYESDESDGVMLDDAA